MDRGDEDDFFMHGFTASAYAYQPKLHVGRFDGESVLDACDDFLLAVLRGVFHYSFSAAGYK